MKVVVKEYVIINTYTNKVVMQFDKETQIFLIYEMCNKLNDCLTEKDKKGTFYNVVTIYEYENS